MSSFHIQDSVSESSVDKSVPMPKIEMVSPEDHQELANDLAQPAEEQLAWSKVREYCQDAFSEFFGTFVLLLFGDGVVAQIVLSKGTKGDYQSISWGWGYESTHHRGYPRHFSY